MTTLKSIMRFITFATLLSCIGCAFGTREVLLKNSTPEKNDTLSITRNHIVCVGDFADERVDENIGHVQNGYGMHTAEVVASNSVPVWIIDEISNRLVTAGYTVKGACPQDSIALVISGKIVKVYTTAYMTYLGEVTINASISRNHQRLLDETYSGHKKSGVNWAATSEAFGDVLKQSLDIAVTRLIGDIDSLDRIDTSPYDASGEVQGASPVAPLPAYDTSVTRFLRDSAGIECPEKNNAVLVVSGKRNASGIRAILDSLIRPKLRKLYNDRFELNPALFGELCVYFEIDETGKVGNIVFLQNTLNDKPIENELISKLSSCKFSKQKKSAEITRITYRLSFSAESAKSSKSAMIALLAILGIVPLVISFINLSRM